MMSLDTIHRKHWQRGFLKHIGSQRADKRQRTAAAEAFRKPLGTHYRSVTLGGRELGDLCPQRTGESWKGLSQAVAAICSNASSFHLICPLFLYQSILASPPCPLRCPQPLLLTPAPTSAIWFSPRCPLTPALWTDYKWHLNNHFPIPSDRETRQTHRASPSKLLWLKSHFWVLVLCQTSVIW